MTADNNNNDIIVSESHNNIIINSNLIGVTECGNWYIRYNENTGKTKLINLLTPIITMKYIMKASRT